MERILYHAYFINNLINEGKIERDEVENVSITLVNNNILKCTHPKDVPIRWPAEEWISEEDITLDENKIYLKRFMIKNADKLDLYIHYFGFCEKCKTIYYRNELKKDYIYEG